MNKLELRKKQKGFTIIEILIVLAIGALIILAVLLAVPALQKSQKNNQRKAEASRVATAVTGYLSDSGGGPIDTTTGVEGIETNLASRAGIKNGKTIFSGVKYNDESPVANISKNIVYVTSGTKCSGTSPTNEGADSTNITVYYALQGQDGYGACLEAQ